VERNSTTEAIVLVNRPYAELHRRVTLLSPDLGIFEAVVYGGRKGKLGGGLEPFTSGLFYLYHNRVRNSYSITDVLVNKDVRTLKSDFERICIANALAEIVMKMDGGGYQMLYTLLGDSLELLDDKQVPSKRIFTLFVWQFIQGMGLVDEFTCCPVCGKEYHQQQVLLFNSSLHAPCCQECADIDVPLGPGARRYLVVVQHLPIGTSSTVELSDQAQMRLYRYMVSYVTTLLGQGLKSLSLLTTEEFTQ